jgi:hypothetical protein
MESDAVKKNRTQRPILDSGIGHFKYRLKEAIGGRSIREFSKSAGLSDGVVRSYLLGNTFPTLDRLDALAATANVKVKWMITGEPPKYQITTDQMYIAKAFKDFSMNRPLAGIQARSRFKKEYKLGNIDVPIKTKEQYPIVNDDELLRWSSAITEKPITNGVSASAGEGPMRPGDEAAAAPVSMDVELMGKIMAIYMDAAKKMEASIPPGDLGEMAACTYNDLMADWPDQQSRTNALKLVATAANNIARLYR